jgi:hypothetical protein
MKNKDSNKKTQKANERFSGTNRDPKTNSPESMLTEEIEIDADGFEKIVQKAINVDGSIAPIPEEEITWNDNQSLSRALKEEQAMKTTKNKDLNPDITANQYTKYNTDNQTDIKKET